MSNEKSLNLLALLAAVVFLAGVVCASFAAPPAQAQIRPQDSEQTEGSPEFKKRYDATLGAAGGCLAGGAAGFATAAAAGPWSAAPYGAVGCATGGFAGGASGYENGVPLGGSNLER